MSSEGLHERLEDSAWVVERDAGELELLTTNDSKLLPLHMFVHLSKMDYAFQY